MKLKIWYEDEWCFCTTCKIIPQEYIRNIHFQFRRRTKKGERK